MVDLDYDVAVVGGGPAGLAAAASARKEGAERVLIIERDARLGGILQQCIHPGFGLKYFNEELTGPEYAGRFVDLVEKLGVDTMTDTMVLESIPGDGLICMSKKMGTIHVGAKSMVLAMGCRERTRGAIAIPGTRPAGIYTAGAAQRLVNLQNEMVGRSVVILGSGDIGMIMARRLTLEGVKVVAVVEIMDYLAGLTRNRVQCLDDFDIPLLLSHTVTEIMGKNRVEGVKVSEVDRAGHPVPGTEKLYCCDTLLLSVGLIPENELTREAKIEIDPVTRGPSVNQYMQTSQADVFAGGNVLHVNDLVDNVSHESERAGMYAARFAKKSLPASEATLATEAGDGVRYVCPQRLEITKERGRVELCFRVASPGEGVTLQAKTGERILARRKARHVSPGEMERLVVDTAALDGGSGVGVVVEAKQEVE